MKIFCKYPVVILACLSTFGLTVAADDLKTAQEIMDYSTAKSTGYQTWSADYSQTMNMLGAQMTVNGQMIQKMPRKMWMQVDMPMLGQQGKMTMVLGDDGMMWQVVDMGPQRQIMKMDLSKIASNANSETGLQLDPLEKLDPRKQWESSRQLLDFTAVQPGELDGQPMYVMEGAWKPAALTNAHTAMAAMVSKTRVFIGQNDGFLHRMEQFDKSKTNLVMAMEFKNLKFNIEVPDSTFEYHPPEGAPVMDLTPMVEMQMRTRTGTGPTPAPETKPPPTP